MRYDDWYDGPSRRCTWCERLKLRSEFRHSDRSEPYANCLACLRALSEKEREKRKWGVHHPYWKAFGKR